MYAARAAERGDAAHRVGRRAAAHLDRTAQRLVQVQRPIGVDQRHRAFHEVVSIDESVVGMGDHVDEGIADPDDVDTESPARRSRLPVAVAADTLLQRERQPLQTPPHRCSQPLPPRARAGSRQRHVLRNRLDRRHRRRRGRLASPSMPTNSTSRLCGSTVLRPRSISTPPAERLDHRGRRSIPATLSSTSRSPAYSTTSCRGWYRSTFNDDDGAQRVIATTQMQATDCRRAFPCFDEPEFKAVFEITLVVEPDLLAVSNGPEISRSTRDDGKARGRLQADDDDEHLPRGIRRRAARGHRADRCRRCPAAGRARAGQGSPHRVRARDRRILAALVPELLRHPVPERQGRHARPARLRRRCDGEPRLHHLSRKPAPGRPEDGDAVRAAERRRCRRPRGGPHVVRRPGDDALVERDLAQRGLRHVHGDRLLRRVSARLAAMDDVQPRAQRGIRDRLVGQHPVGRVPGRSARRTATACSTC